MSIDPVCKMEIVEDNARHRTEYQEKIYYFCSNACKTAFKAKPDKYLKEKPWWKIW